MRSLEEKRKQKREYMRKYNAKDPTYNRAHAKAYRKKHGRKPSTRPQRSTEYRETIIYFLIDRDGLDCGFCQLPVDMGSVQIDHIVPVMLGGVNRMSNLRLAHAKCNFDSGRKVRQQIYGR